VLAQPTVAQPRGATTRPATRPGTRPAFEGRILSPTLTTALGELVSELAADARQEGAELKLPSTAELTAWAGHEELFYVFPETERRFGEGDFDDEANARTVRRCVEALEELDASLPRVLRFVVERHENGELEGAQLELAARMLVRAVRSTRGAMYLPSATRPATGPAGRKLSFRVAPKAPGVTGSRLLRREGARHVRRLQGHGPTSRPADADYQWFELPGPAAPVLVTRQHEGTKYILLSDRPDETMLPERGWGLEEAWVDTDELGNPCVYVRFDEAGARKLRRLTSANRGRHLAILVDDKVYSVPVIRGVISERAVISGRFTRQEAAELARALRVGMTDSHKLRPAPPVEPERPSRAPRPGSPFAGKVYCPALAEGFAKLTARTGDEPFSPQELERITRANPIFYARPELARRFAAGRFDDESNRREFKRLVDLLRQREPEAGLLELLGDEQLPHKLDGAELEVAVRFVSGGIESGTGSAPIGLPIPPPGPDSPPGSTLSFRVVARPPTYGGGALSAEDVSRCRTRLQQHGAVTQPADENYLWFPLYGSVQQVVVPELDSRSAGDLLVMSEYDGRTYVLLSNRPGERMVPGEGWGVRTGFLDRDYASRWAARVLLDEPGARRLHGLIEAHGLCSLAVLVDGQVVRVPMYEGESGVGMGLVMVSGPFTAKDAAELAWALRVGMRPAEPATQPVALEPAEPLPDAAQEWD
jgi:hypothetical protein